MSDSIENVLANEITRIFAEGIHGKMPQILAAANEKLGEADEPNTFTYGIGLSCTIQHKDGAWIPQMNITWSVKHTATMRGNKCSVQREDPLEETPLGEQRELTVVEGENGDGAHVESEAVTTTETPILQAACEQVEQSTEKPNEDVTPQMIEQAMEIIRETQRASLGALVRRMKISNTVGSALMEALEMMQYVGGPPKPGKSREITVDWNQYDIDHGIVKPEPVAEPSSEPTTQEATA